MKILAVTYRPPVPTTRGDGLRLVGFLRALATRHQVLCCFPRVTDAARTDLAAAGIHALPCERVVPDPRWAGAPWQVAASAMWRAPASALDGADVIHMSTVRSMPLVRAEHLARAHMDFVDALSKNTEERAAASRLGGFWRLEAGRLRAFEAEVVATVGTTSCVSAADRDALSPSTRVIPNGVTLVRQVAQPADAPTILFHGNLGYFANADAACWLATAIFPRVLDALPGARLVLAGARPTRPVRRLAGLPNVELNADVADMASFIGRAWVVAAPVRYGTGLQNKVLEAFAHSRPVVTTTAVAARLEGAVAGRQLEAADEAQELAALLVRLLRDQARRERLVAAATELLRSYEWDRGARLLESLYRP